MTASDRILVGSPAGLVPAPRPDPEAAAVVGDPAASGPSRADAGGSAAPGGDPDTSCVRAAVVRFVLVAVVALAVVSVPAAAWMNAVAYDHAMQDAERRAQRLADSTIAPFVDARVLTGDPAAMERLDEVVDARISDGSVTRIKVWDLSGTIVYSDAQELIGRRFPIGEWRDELSVTGDATAKIETPEGAENASEAEHGRLVEVYALTTAASGDPLVFEAYFPLDDVLHQQEMLMTRLLPVILAALLALMLVQLPSAVRLARSVEQGNAVQRRLLQQAVAASDHERRRIARDLHDDVIQDLAGVAYALESIEPRMQADARAFVSRARSIIRKDVATLRGMLTELYPADLDSVGLPGAVEQLAEPLREQSVDVDVDVPEVHVDRTTATLLYRVAREALTNVAKHADARRVVVRVQREPGVVRLTVQDDGRGMQAAAPARGHLGLRLVRDTVAEAGGRVHIESRPGEGTCVDVRLPQP